MITFWRRIYIFILSVVVFITFVWTCKVARYESVAEKNSQNPIIFSKTFLCITYGFNNIHIARFRVFELENFIPLLQPETYIIIYMYMLCMSLIATPPPPPKKSNFSLVSPFWWWLLYILVWKKKEANLHIIYALLYYNYMYYFH